MAGFAVLLLPNTLRALSRAAALLIAVAVFIMAISVFTGETSPYERSILEIGDFKLDLLLAATPLSSFILMFAMGFGVLILVYSLKTMAGAKRLNEYYAAVLLTIGGSGGILLSDHLLFLLIFWEIVTASLYLLIATGGKQSNFAATKTFAMIGASDGAFLLGIAMVWKLSETFVISDISLATTGPLPIIAFLLLLLAAITKAGAMPLHTWLPTSSEHAPTSVMALLPAAIDKLLGIFLLVLITKKMFELKPGALSIVLAAIGAVTILIAVMVAMVQHNLKKLLSYHAISQVGYMILGIATMTTVGVAGAVFHMLNNAIYKCCLFLCGGAVEQATGTSDLERLGGLGKKMSLTFTACLIASLSISGIPPFNGFVSKWMVYQGVVEMGSTQAGAAGGFWPLWLVCAMFGSALTLASFVKIIHSMFLSRLPDDLEKTKEVSLMQTAPMLILAALCVIFGVFYMFPLKQFIYPAVVPAEQQEGLLNIWNAGLATILMLAAIALGIIIWVLMKLSKNVRIVPTWACGEIQPNDEMIIPGTHFYKTVSSMNGLKQLYEGQSKGYFDLYDQGGRFGMIFTDLLKWVHGGVLPTYLTWVTIGLLIVLFALCDIW